MKIKGFLFLLTVILILVFLVVFKPISISFGTPGEAAIPKEITTSLVSSPQLDMLDPADLEAFLDGAIAMQLNTYHIAGATVAVVHDREIVLVKGYGFADLGAGLPVDPEVTSFRIGSITKLFTWTAVMHLMEQGLLDLDADINTYLDFTIPATFPEPITLKHLMAHTAGFEEMGFGMFAAEQDAMVSNGQWLKTHIPARVREPGLVSSYSNYGAALAGYIVERQVGMSYEQYIERSILVPLQMFNSSAAQPLPSELASQVSQGYSYSNAGFIAKDFEWINAAPAGSISATAADMARFMIAHLNKGEFHGQRILSDATADTMQSRLWGADDRLNGWAYGFYEMSQNEVRVIGHGGDTRLFHSLLALLPGEDLGFFVSYNTETDSMAPQKLFELFMERYFPAAPAEMAAPPTDTLVHAAQVAGSYRLNRIVYSRAGKIDSLLQPLMVQSGPDGSLVIPTPLGTMRFVETAPYFYQQVGGDDKVVFWVDESGKVTQTFINSFPMMAAERVPWYEVAILHLVLVAVSLFLSFTTLLIALLTFIATRGRKELAPSTRLALASRWVLGITSVLCLVFVLLYAVSLSNPMLRLTGQRSLLDGMSLVALLVLLFAVACVVLSAYAWVKKYWRLAGRLHYTAVTMSLAIFAVLLLVYNQVGWRW